MSRPPVIDRREAIRRAALLLGGAISAPAVAAVLAGCGERRRADRGRIALTADQQTLVCTIAEHIIPATDTPGATAAGVPAFIQLMLAEYYDDDDRAHFLDGLADVDARARRAHQKRFAECTADTQHEILAALDAEAYPWQPGVPRTPFFRVMKELTLLGYYTSEVGATRELRYEPVPGRFDGCVPFATIGRAWSVG
jgi:hypothetical protein